MLQMQKTKVVDFNLFCYNILNCFYRNLFYGLTIFLYYSLLFSHNFDWSHIILWANSLDDMSLPANISLCLFVILSPPYSLVSIIFLSCQHTCSSHNFDWSYIVFLAITMNNYVIPLIFLYVCLRSFLSHSCRLISTMFLSCQHNCSAYNLDWFHIILWPNTLMNMCHLTIISLSVIEILSR